MKINIAYPTNATQASFEINTKAEQMLYGKKLNEQFDGKILDAKYEGAVVQLVGGNDYQGIPMNPSQATTKRIRLLLCKGAIGYRCTRNGVRRRKTVRGSVVSNEIQALNVILVKPANGKEIEGLTDEIKNKTHLPKRDKKLRALFGVPAQDDTMTYITNLLKANNEDAVIPKIKITGVMSEEKKQKIANQRAARAAKKELLNAEKVEYETKYGIKL